MNQVLSIVPHDLLVLLVSMLMVDIMFEVYAFSQGLSLDKISIFPRIYFPPLRTRLGVTRELYGTGFENFTPRFSWICGFNARGPSSESLESLGKLDLRLLF